MYEKFTERTKKVIHHAHREAERMGIKYIGTEHLLLGLLREGTGVAATALQRLGVEPNRARLEVEKLTRNLRGAPTTAKPFAFTPRAQKVVFEHAFREAKKEKQSYVRTEHILLGLLREEECVAAQVLLGMDIALEEVEEHIRELQGHPLDTLEDEESQEPGAERSKTPALDSFGRDLTRQAYNGELDPVIGREKEIERVIQVLCRRKKNNPVLLGEAGVGKTAIVEGLAQDIVSGNVPTLLNDRRIVVVDLALMVAGTKYRGQFEERIKAVMQEVRKAKNVILFIDELHTLVGAGGAEGAIDASNVLKPALARGEAQCIGATTPDEYRKYVEKDAALERRFQTIMVDPPSREETLDILKGLRARYEEHHCVRIIDEALLSSIDLSMRYITGRFLPDKALDVIDEASSMVRLRGMTALPEVKEIQRELSQLTIEKEQAVIEQDFERAAHLRDEIETLNARKKTYEDQRSRREDETVGVVDENVVREVVSRMTGVPLERLRIEERSRLLRMESEIHSKLISQNEAVSAVSRAVRRSRSGMKDPRRPVASFLFIGPTGVGKTLLARCLAKFLFGDEDALLQIDMSEFMEKHNVSRLVGAPPGYVGYDEGGQLTERIRRRPYSVVLFDEIEKAHAEVFNMLLQIMEDGRLTDSYGRQVDFRNTVLIMTSNIGAEVIKNSAGLGFRKRAADTDYETMKKQLIQEVDKHFRPEFLNRVDDTIVFRSLTREDLRAIIHLELDKVRDRMARQNMELLLSDEAVELLIDKGYNPDFGARPLRRAIERYIEDPLSEDMLAGKIVGGTVYVDTEDDELTFENRQPTAELPHEEPTPASSS
ncbi:MAG: ATP-dependent Clp protease ATP-binding subunit [Planctomycetes bacterium]|nr:ATP-dependent Clp protease ATP-binding subunit [Planctomycetota bacterium]